MTTLFCNPRSNSRRVEGHGRLGHAKAKVKPQATLSFIPGRPPVLDPAPPAPTPDKPQHRRNMSLPGQMWNHLTNMFSSPPPVYWVNQHLIHDTPPPPPPPQHHQHHHQYHHILPCGVVDPRSNLWHAAEPGNTQEQLMMEPQQMLRSYPYACYTAKQGQLYPSSYPSPPPPPPPPYKTSTKSLNPYAQEYVPMMYRTAPPVPASATHKVPLGNSPESKIVNCHDFCEITDEEVRDARTEGRGDTLAMSPTLGTGSVSQCHGTVPQCPVSDVRRVTPVRTQLTSPRTDESDCCVQSLSPTSLDSEIPVGGGKVESPVSRSPSVSPAVVCEDGESQSSAVICKENEKLSPVKSSEVLQAKSPVCVTSISDETRKSTSPEESSPGSVESFRGSVGLNQVSKSLPPTGLTPEHKNHSTSPTSQSEAAKETHTTTESPENPHLPNTPSILDRKCADVSAGLLVPPGSATGESASTSYAGVVGRASPSPPPPADPTKSRYKGVEQPIPKIFQGDRSPLRETDIPKVESNTQGPLLFKRPSKSQRSRSRDFLKELKDWSLNGDVCGSPSSTSDLSVSSDDLASPPMSPQPGSPQGHVSCLSVSSCPVTPMATSPSTTSPLAIPIPIPATSQVQESPDTRTRSSSESSADVDFVDEVDRASLDRATPLKSAGGRNTFLACILGSGDSESESEDDSDWDECVDDSMNVLDDSWETFGFGLVVVECRVASVPPQPPQQPPHHSDTKDEYSSDPHLRDLNRKWNEDVRREVRGKTEQKVRFGAVTVHPMVVWSHAYRQARRGPWEQQARDRARFAQRVASLEPELSLVLAPGHRRRVYRRLHAPPSPPCFI